MTIVTQYYTSYQNHNMCLILPAPQAGTVVIEIFFLNASMQK